MRICGFAPWLLVLSFGVAARPALGLPASVDADQDGVVDALEVALGSSPGNAASTPESLAVSQSCLDGEDDDLDGVADLDDPGCELPAASDTTFPPAGDDVFEATLELRRYPLDTPFGICPISVSARGAVVVRRAEPSPAREVELEVVALQVDGTAEFHAQPDYPDCLIPPSTFDVSVFEDPSQISTGRLTDDAPEPERDLPALGFVDLHFDLAWGWQKATLVPGGPPEGPAGAPLRLTNRVNTLPAYLGRNPACWASSNHELCVTPPPGSYLCYEGSFDAPDFERSSVSVSGDVFEPATHELKLRKPALACTPASHDARPVYDPIGHLACYKVKPEKTPPPSWKSKLVCRAAKRDQEGLSRELPTVLDDYVCYQDTYTDRFGPEFERRPIAASDDLGIVESDVIAPKLRCNPVSIDGPIQNPGRFLECFKLAPTRVRETMVLFDRIGEFVEEVTTSRAVSLCVPSSESKTELH